MVRHHPHTFDAVSLRDVGKIVGEVDLKIAAPVDAQAPVIPRLIVRNRRVVAGGAQGLEKVYAAPKTKPVGQAFLRRGCQGIVVGVAPELIQRDRAVPRVDGAFEDRSDVGGGTARSGRIQIRLVERPARSDWNVVLTAQIWPSLIPLRPPLPQLPGVGTATPGNR